MPDGERAPARFPLTGKRVWVAGHKGLVGSAILRRLARVDCAVLTAKREKLDLLRQAAVEAWMAEHRPEVVIIAAGKVGGIAANSAAPADFLYENLMINANIIHAAHRAGVERLVCLGSSCIYPRSAPQPLGENALLTGALEPTNEAYAISKIAALKLAEAHARQYGRSYFGLMPCNLYGPNDNFDPETSHVLPALIRKFSEAVRRRHEVVTLWGTGRPLREFMHVDDLAEAVVFLAQVYEGHDFVNVGTDEEVSIAELARLVAATTGFRGRVVFDPSKPDGTPRKKLDVSRLRSMGWSPRISLREGLRRAHASWLELESREAPVRHASADR